MLCEVLDALFQCWSRLQDIYWFVWYCVLNAKVIKDIFQMVSQFYSVQYGRPSNTNTYKRRRMQHEESFIWLIFAFVVHKKEIKTNIVIRTKVNIRKRRAALSRHIALVA